jgi:hypothetical protein
MGFSYGFDRDGFDRQCSSPGFNRRDGFDRMEMFIAWLRPHRTTMFQWQCSGSVVIAGGEA